MSRAMRSTHVERLHYFRLVGLVSLTILFTSVLGLSAASHGEMNREAFAALNHLYSTSPAARRVGESASAVLIFPSLAQDCADLRVHRYGALFDHGKVIGYYKSVVASYGMPKRMQKFSYALFFMSDEYLAQLRKRGGWEIGIGPKVVMMEENQNRNQQAAASASASANKVVTIAPSPATIVAHTSQITHRSAMNDQQEAAPRPNNLTLDPKYRGFIPIPNAGLPRDLTTTPLRKGIYAFAFGERALIAGLSLKGTKITPVHPD